MALKSLDTFLRAAGGKSTRIERQQVAGSVAPFAFEAYIDQKSLENTLLPSAFSANSLQKHVAVITVMQVFWRLVPERLFTSADPNYRKLANESAARLGIELGSGPLRNLMAIFKRLRSFKDEGRSATSLDLKRSEHHALLKAQAGRCAVCRYEFTSGDIDLYLENEIQLRIPHIRLADSDITLEHIVRVPVLDHILPVFLGGDGPANWQILCHACNSGKGSCWTAAGGAWFRPPTTVSAATRLRPALRYTVLATVQKCCDCLESDLFELRVVRLDHRGLPTYANLTSQCVRCMCEVESG